LAAALKQEGGVRKTTGTQAGIWRRRAFFYYGQLQALLRPFGPDRIRVYLRRPTALTLAPFWATCGFLEVDGSFMRRISPRSTTRFGPSQSKLLHRRADDDEGQSESGGSASFKKPIATDGTVQNAALYHSNLVEARLSQGRRKLLEVYRDDILKLRFHRARPVRLARELTAGQPGSAEHTRV